LIGIMFLSVSKPRPWAHAFLAGAVCFGGCARGKEPASGSPATPPVRPSILLVTLDTTRADAVGPEAPGIETPAFNALAARGRRFRRAYAAVPETLPSHTSMMTGLYPAGHGIHENARTLSADHPLLAERLQQAGYRTAAFVSSFVLARRFGLGRGFDAYDDVESAERPARETTDRAVEYLRGKSDRPLLLWVHYFDAHAPYAPPEPFRTRYAKNPYLGEVAVVDEQLGRLVTAFESAAAGPVAVVVVGDHGEGLGDHGESQHGNLLYEATMHVPLLMVGPGVKEGIEDTPVSIRRIFHTVLDLAGWSSADSLRSTGAAEVVLGEAMKPFLEYGWQPQVMAVDGRHKVIVAGRTEVYDVADDPKETRDLAESVTLSRPARNGLKDYPPPSPGAARVPSSLGEEDRKKLASLGYVSAGAAPVVRKDAPRPVDMAALFDVIERASDLFVREEYAQVIPLLERIRAKDAFNLDAVLRLATAHSALGHDQAAESMFEKAKELAPLSLDVRTYFALHLAGGARWREAAPLLEKIAAESPDRVPVLEALARVRERQGRTRDALALWLRIHSLRRASPLELVKVGELAMAAEDTEIALRSFEAAHLVQGADFRHNLELGVLYLSARRFEDARDALDRVSPQHPAYPMALFKRAQVSVLLREPDRGSRIEAARRGADATTRELIARERLFQSDQR
jgi:arylsulfatase A-like enzyme/Flp pilus assembly protein TadD